MIKIDPDFANSIPPLSDEEKYQLQENIIREGCRDPLVLWGDILLDGHNRYEICTKLDLPFKTTNLNFNNREDAADWIDRNQLGRRNLSPDQMSLLRGRRYNRVKKADGQRGPKKLDQNEPASTAEKLAKEHGVSPATIKRDGKFAEAVEKVKQVTPDIEKKVATKVAPPKRDVIEAAKMLDSHPEQAKSVLSGDKNIASVKREIKKEELKDTAPKELPPGKFTVLLADPPWQYNFSLTDNRKIENQYPTMTLDQIKAIPVSDSADKDAVLFLWATSPKLPDALEVMKAWGFEYSTCAVWDKKKIGMGYYFRQQHELLLVGKVGNPGLPDPENRASSVIEEPRSKHSSKPEKSYAILERMYPKCKKLELFARSKRDGWTPWGNEY